MRQAFADVSFRLLLCQLVRKKAPKNVDIVEVKIDPTSRKIRLFLVGDGLPEVFENDGTKQLLEFPELKRGRINKPNELATCEGLLNEEIDLMALGQYTKKTLLKIAQGLQVNGHSNTLKPHLIKKIKERVAEIKKVRNRQLNSLHNDAINDTKNEF